MRPAGFGGEVEVVRAARAARGFPTRVTEALGVCLKSGPSHGVLSDGRRLTYPADALCVRSPGCVWSSEVGVAGFLSVDIGPALFAERPRRQRMQFFPSTAVPRFVALVHRLENHPDELGRQEALAELAAALGALGALGADELGEAPRPRAVHAARDLLASSLDEKPTLDDLARATGMNKFVLTRQFKRTFGTTPHNYLMFLRVERARALLARGSTPIEAAAALGFADQGHFSRQFKRLVGITPGSFARMVRVMVPRTA